MKSVKTTSKELIILFFRSKTYRWICFSLFLISAIIYIIQLRTKDLQLFPKNNNFKYGLYTDSSVNGSSIITNQNLTDSLLHFSFLLKEGFINPYVGINFAQDDKATFDLSAFNQLELEICGEDLKNLVVVLVTQNNNNEIITSNNQLIFTANIEISSTKSNYKINFDRLKAPEWWYEINKLSPLKEIHPDLQKVISFSIMTGAATIKQSERSLTIHSILFTKNSKWLLITLITSNLFILIALFTVFIFKIKSKNKTETITIDNKPVSTNNETIQQYRFLEYINNNFNDSELSLESISLQTGINQRRIANTIMTLFGCNFKTYVNQIRINKAKQLLKETDFNISEIAFQVGFNSPNHFNRVFKSVEGISPTIYKERSLS